MEFLKDLLGHVEHVLRKNHYAVIVYLLSAVNEVIGLHVGESLAQALLVQIFFLLTRGMSVEAVRHDYVLEAIVLAVGDAWLVLLCALEEA